MITLRTAGDRINTATTSMVVSTKVENGRTVRTWQEARSNGKTFTRKFYIKYEVNAICNGKYYLLGVRENLDDAERMMRDTWVKVEKKYHPQSWHKSKGEITSHVRETGYWSTVGASKSISLYISEVGAGEVISEVIS